MNCGSVMPIKCRCRHKIAEPSTSSSPSTSASASSTSSDSSHHIAEHWAKRREPRDIEVNEMSEIDEIRYMEDAQWRSSRRKKTSITLITKLSRFLLFLIVFAGLFEKSKAIVEIRCGPIEIRNSPRGYEKKPPITLGDSDSVIAHEELSHVNCTVVEGSFIIAFVGGFGNNRKSVQEDYPRFPNLREITGTLLVFDAEGLKTLSWILPNLRVIGGQILIQHYALIIYKNSELENLGLEHLTVIRNGGVRITDNKRLCHTRTIDWKGMILSKMNDVVLDDAAESSVTETGKICPKGDCEYDAEQTKCRYIEWQEGHVQSCWNETTCQKACAYDRMNGQIGPGCDPQGNKCDDECIGGCDKPNDPRLCHACKNFHYQGRCVPKCADNLYKLLNRRCVTKEKCLSLNPERKNLKLFIKATNGLCSDRCPEGYEENVNDRHTCVKCKSECQITCSKNYTIDTYSKALEVRDCHIIDGSLTIEVRGATNSGIASEIGRSFSKIHTIRGYLMIYRSPTFVNFHMFKNLKQIQGKFLYQEKYSLAIFDNANLKELFNEKSPFVIERGAVQVHNNRMLCFDFVTSLMKSLGKLGEMSELDQSRSSNGDKAICWRTTFNVTVLLVTNESILLRWPSYNTSDIDDRKFMGYEVFYKEVERIDWNMTINEDRNACADSWQSFYIEKKPESDNSKIQEVSLSSQQNIKPYTHYAIYVTTHIVHHFGASNAISNINFVTTKFSTPDPPIVTVHKVLSDKIELHWEPPARPNGIITHYMISWREIDVDLQFMASQFCSVDPLSHHTRPDVSPMDESDDASSTTSAPSLASMFGGAAPPGTCSSINGCCDCPKTRIDAEETEDKVVFENKLHDVVFVQRKFRRRRSINPSLIKENEEEVKKKEEVDEGKTKGKEKSRIHIEKKNKNGAEGPFNTEAEEKLIAVRLWAKNVTAKLMDKNTFTITGLKHYTQYSITVSACQDVHVEESKCSPGPKAAKMKRTKPLPDVDKVKNETIKIDYLNTTSTVRVTWESPKNSNGGIQGYYVKLNSLAESAPHQHCQPAIDGNWTSHDDGVVFKGLADGEYKVEIVAVSMFKTASEGSISDEIVKIYTPGFWTIKKIIAASIGFVVFLIIASLIGYYTIKKYYGRKVKQMADFMTHNPEYIAKEIYKEDEWELKRDDLELLDEIGMGTFGKVYRGYGKDVESKCGVKFGECAIKTVQNQTNGAERLHFLMEANVMKKFDAAFIVKLYGVVSSGQPTLCVMELMSLGNLRDYLRSRRPGENENSTELSVPSKEQYHEWASQIADGMAYLESIKFCHRDLAARNCMVRADEMVKIGDFGMARDLYYHDYYKPTGKRLMPVRWMAPESLKDGRFDSKSDCWSYGIVLYEMLTLGQQPYQGLGNDEVLNYIGMSRKILDRPLECPEYWYKIMKMCWRYQPKDRPSFAQLVHLLAPHASENFAKLSYVCNNAMKVEETGTDDEEHFDGEEEEADYVAEPGEAGRTRTDSMPMREFRPCSSRSSSSHSSLMMSRDSRKSSVRSLLNMNTRLHGDHHRHHSLDRMSGIGYRSDNGTIGTANDHFDDGDYVEKDVRIDDVMKKPLAPPSLSSKTSAESNIENDDGYCMSNRNGAMDFPSWGEGERLTTRNGGGSYSK